MKTKGFLRSLIVFVLVIVAFHHITLANSADNSLRDITIDSFTSGELETAVTDINAILVPAGIETLTITEGTVNATDFEWIKDNLTDLETLEISGNAKVHSTSDTPVETPDNTVPGSALFNMSTLKEVTISSATSISNNAFNSCDSLETISLPNATTIGNYAFSECSVLTDVELSEVTSIGKGAFFSSYTLESINLPKLESIGEDAFTSSNISTLYLGSGAPTVGSDAFSGCPNPRTIIIPQNSETDYKSADDGNTGDEEWYGWSIYEISDDATLSSITVSDEVLEPDFTSTTTEYYVTVSYPTEKITITPTTNHSYATLTVEGNTVTSGESVEVDLSIGINEISIVVTASDDATISETIIAVTRTEAQSVTIDSFTSSDLGSAVTTIHGTPEDITSLTITGGIVNANDFEWIKNNLSNLETLELSGNAKVDSGTDSFMDDNTVPGGALESMNTLKEVTISSATTIGEEAFYQCTSLISVNLPKVTNIEYAGFSECEELNSISIPLVETIGEEAFYSCDALVELDLPVIDSIGDVAFDGCRNLETIKLPLATNIGDYAFSYTGLLNVDLPNAMTIGEGAFARCDSLISISAPKVTIVEESTFKDCTSLTSLDLPNAVTIGGGLARDGAFTNCEALESIDLPMVTTIEPNAFYDCDQLEILTLGENPPTAATNSFVNCADPRTIKVPAGKGPDYKSASDGNTGDELWYGWNVYEISNDATLANLETNPVNIDQLFESTVKNYTAAVTYPTETIGIRPEASDSNTTITVEGNEVSSGSSVYVGLSTGENVINIIVTAEDGSTTEEYIITVTRSEAQSVTIESFDSGDLESAVTAAYSTLDNINSLIITEGVVNSEDFEWIVDGLSGIEVLEISGNAKVHSTSDSPVDTPDNTVPEDVFSGMIGLKEVTISSATTIGSNAFESCEDLESVDLPEVTTIGESAFSNCDSLESIDLPEVITIGERVFSESGLISIDLPEAIIIQSGAFSDCESFTSISAPKVETIGDDVFQFCRNLISVDLPMVKVLGEQAFQDNNSLVNIELPKAETIGNRAFLESTKLTSVNLPVVTSLGDSVFADCTSLNSITLGETVPTVGNNTFSYISSDSPTVKVPMGSGSDYKADTSDGDETDDKWHGLTIYEISNDAILSNLTINSGSLNPAFNSATTDYSANVSYGINSINITPTTNHGKATVTVEGSETRSGEAVNISLNTGTNEINIVVTAEDGSMAQTIVKVTRASYVPYTPSTNAYLRSLRLDGINLSPTFSLSTYNYEANVTSEIKSTKLSASVYDYRAKMQINGQSVSDSASKTISLNPGKNVITVTVTAENSYYKKTYTITVNREASEIEENIGEAEDIDSLKEIYENISAFEEEEKQSLLKQITEKAFEMMEDLSEIDFIQSVIDDMKEGEIKEEYETRLGGKEMIYGEEYSDWDEHKETEQPINKVWNVKFNFTIDEETIVAGDNYIAVVDKDGYRIEIELEYEKESKELKIKPVADYEPGKKYYLILGTEIRNEEGVSLKDPIRLEFSTND
ncbi:leucine-rich repeat protein [Wukongibacter baidiensis]|uniref:leucine-rich repeat protein n=1 Tax=Wukongibacter baidiensis TaxID=1723361 RepID=UPI003D7FE000